MDKSSKWLHSRKIFRTIYKNGKIAKTQQGKLQSEIRFHSVPPPAPSASQQPWRECGCGLAQRGSCGLPHASPWRGGLSLLLQKWKCSPKRQRGWVNLWTKKCRQREEGTTGRKGPVAHQETREARSVQPPEQKREKPSLASQAPCLLRGARLPSCAIQRAVLSTIL